MQSFNCYSGWDLKSYFPLEIVIMVKIYIVSQVFKNTDLLIDKKTTVKKYTHLEPVDPSKYV
jgi:hypothetical protein